MKTQATAGGKGYRQQLGKLLGQIDAYYDRHQSVYEPIVQAEVLRAQSQGFH